MIAQLLLSVALVTAQPTQVDPADFGPWAGVIECESGGNVTIENPHSTASGLFQFLDTTWQWVTTDMGRPDLAAVRAKDASVPDQLAAAIHLRDMPGGGISHWVCGYRYGEHYGEHYEPTRVPALPTQVREPKLVFELHSVPHRNHYDDWPAGVM